MEHIFTSSRKDWAAQTFLYNPRNKDMWFTLDATDDRIVILDWTSPLHSVNMHLQPQILRTTSSKNRKQGRSRSLKTYSTMISMSLGPFSSLQSIIITFFFKSLIFHPSQHPHGVDQNLWCSRSQHNKKGNKAVVRVKLHFFLIIALCMAPCCIISRCKYQPSMVRNCSRFWNGETRYICVYKCDLIISSVCFS